MADLLLENLPPLAICSDTGIPCPLQREIESLQEQIRELADKAHTDLLTGLHNYRYFQETLPLEMERTLRSGQPLALILLDIDHFKVFNDQWGHEAGNRALAHIGVLIKNALRKLDIACRYGGEEFVIVLPDTSLREAIGVAERLRLHIESTPLLMGEEELKLTASLGVDEYRYHSGECSSTLLSRTDQWLYRAKEKGRNQVAHRALNPRASHVNTMEKDMLFKFFDDPENSPTD